MTEPIELIMYSRTTSCPFVSLAKRILDKEQIPYREIFIDTDRFAAERVEEWTGFLSVPTLVIARSGEIVPKHAPDPLQKGTSPRGIDRGPMITEPNEEQLTAWLRHFGLLPDAATEARNE